jgi:hypothetical protein
VITGKVCCGDVFSPFTTAADAPLVIAKDIPAKDIPAAPHTGKAFFERFRFVACFGRAIMHLP